MNRIILFLPENDPTNVIFSYKKMEKHAGANRSISQSINQSVKLNLYSTFHTVSKTNPSSFKNTVIEMEIKEQQKLFYQRKRLWLKAMNHYKSSWMKQFSVCRLNSAWNIPADSARLPHETGFLVCSGLWLSSDSSAAGGAHAGPQQRSDPSESQRRC